MGRYTGKRLEKRQTKRQRKRRQAARWILALVLLTAGTLMGYRLTARYLFQTEREPEGAIPTIHAPQTPAPPHLSIPPQETSPEQTSPETLRQQDNYPELISQSGTYTTYQGTNQIRVDQQAFDLCGYSQSTAATYAKLVSSAAEQLAGQTKVYSLPIPTAYGITLPDDIRKQLPVYIDQGESIQNIFGHMSDHVVQVNCYDNLMRHRDEYLYFGTDHHWNGRGAYYAYESFCQAKGVTPYTLEQREEVAFDGFLGTLYRGNGQDPQLLPDTVYAYKPHSQSATMTYYDKDGTATSWPIISNVSQWAASSKYSTFAGGDHPLTVFHNPEVPDQSVCIVVKDSFGNALLPYLVDHYTTIYEIDFRYWKGDLVAYAREQGADDLIFANNVMTISTGLLVGTLSNMIPAH